MWAMLISTPESGSGDIVMHWANKKMVVFDELDEMLSRDLIGTHLGSKIQTYSYLSDQETNISKTDKVRLA